MTSKLLKSTSRGQITLPKQWRNHFTTDSYLAVMQDDKLVLTPFHIDGIDGQEVLLDADRDNNGKGFSPDDFINALQTIQNG
jgi:bifunctional DNA-binding transcriptional regulator/antitoxin component of YhaV-PrlF toxin-antitoxin module